MDQVLSCRWVESADQQEALDWFSAPGGGSSSLSFSTRPAMIRSQLRSALRRCPTEEGVAPVGSEGAGPAEVGPAGGGAPVAQLQSLIAQRMQRAQELLEEMRLQVREPPREGRSQAWRGRNHTGMGRGWGCDVTVMSAEPVIDRSCRGAEEEEQEEVLHTRRSLTLLDCNS